MPKGKRTLSGSYSQNWPAYYEARVNEEPHFHWLLKELCCEIEEPAHITGRRPFLLADMVYSMVYKVYSGRATQRFEHNLQEAYDKGFIKKPPKPNTLSDYMRMGSLTPILYHLLVMSSLPLAEVENIFAVDSSGFSAPRRRYVFNRHKGRWEKKRDHIKLHIICGVKTNVITCAEVTAGTVSDRNFLKPLVERTARYFNISEVSADGGYLSGENFRTVILLGGKPYIAFYKNCALDADFKSLAWKETLRLWKDRNQEIMNKYYLRNNVEAIFSSIKRVFGEDLKSKSDTGLINEVLCKALCHNICVLVHSMFELGINPTSWSNAKLTSRAQTNSIGVALTDTELSLVQNRIAVATVKPPLQPVGTDELANRGKRSSKSRRGKERDENQISLFKI